MEKNPRAATVPLDPPPNLTYPQPQPYGLDWSGAMGTCPEWFRDAKFGIFFHWGPYCVPEYDNEWYSRNMYTLGHKANQYHTEHYGSIREYGYKNLYNLFTGEHFDAAQWTKLFARAGARYLMACAEHADGFAMWNSRVNPANSVNYGPGRDVIGALHSAARQQGLWFGASLHHSWNWGWFCSTDPLADVYNPRNELFYGPAVPLGAIAYFTPCPPSRAFQENWLAKCKEVVDNFLPDTIYFDSRVYIIGEKYRLAFAEYYYEAARKAGRQVIFSYKDYDFQAGSGILDYECGWRPDIEAQPWQCEDKSSWESWSYIRNATYKTPRYFIHQLADIVSKNGNFLLNVGPRADGSFDGETVAILEAVGDWLAVNGEAIYGTRPFSVYGEGPVRQAETQVVNAGQAVHFTAEDVRFTQKDGALYAILLGWPFAGRASIKALRTGGQLQRPVQRVSLLGHSGPLHFLQDGTALTVTLPEAPPCRDAFVLKIEA